MKRLLASKAGMSHVKTAVLVLVMAMVFSAVFLYASIMTIVQASRDQTRRVLDDFIMHNSIEIYDSLKNGNDLAEELEKAYSIYTGRQREQTYSFHPRTVSQRSEISAVSSRVVYCVTEVQLPGDASHSDSFSRCAAFDRETGEPISLLELFSCPVEEAVGRLLDIIQEQDTAFADIRDTAERELSPDNLPECLAVYEDGITVMFPVGKDGEYGIKLYFDSCLSLIALLEDWAVPVPYSQNA